MDTKMLSFAKWLGSLAIVSMGSFAIAMPVVVNDKFDTPFNPIADWTATNTVSRIGTEAVFSGTDNPDKPMLEQLISGFVSGAGYELSFSFEVPDEGDVGVMVGSVFDDTLGNFGLPMEFIADGTSLLLKFTYFGGDGGTLFLDNIAIRCSDNSPILGCIDPDLPPQGLPEPSSLLLVGAAMVAGAWVRRKKRI